MWIRHKHNLFPLEPSKLETGTLNNTAINTTDKRAIPRNKVIANEHICGKLPSGNK